MKKTTAIHPLRKKEHRNAAEPFSIPMQAYALPVETLVTHTGIRKSRKAVLNPPSTRFISFAGRTLILDATLGADTHTLTLTLQPNELTIACSCAAPVATLCPHAFGYLLWVASYGNSSSFGEFSEEGVIETALSHPSSFNIQYTGRHGIRAELKNGLGRVYELENNWVTPHRLQPFQHLPGQTNQTGSQPQNGLVLCYLLMMSPRETAAPFILPCAGVLTKDGMEIKRFTHYLSGADGGLSQWLTPEHVPRIKACTELMKGSEKAPGLQNLAEATGEEAEALAELFHLFRSSLSLFSGAFLYSHPWWGKKRMGSHPLRRSATPVVLARGTVTLRFRLHLGNGVYTLTLALLISGKEAEGYRIEGAFFISLPGSSSLYMFSSPR
ncbi:MAG: hypothetical protein INR73_28725, partial [Williamsia sp.]|nr:hypothetical protein [Williamsia sp.]